MTESLAHDEEAMALEQIVRNQIAIAELEEQNAMLKQFFKDRPEQYAAGTKIQRGKFTLTVTSNTRIDQKLADKELSIRDMNKVSKRVVDSTLARRYLDEDTLAKITKTYDNRLSFGLAD